MWSPERRAALAALAALTAAGCGFRPLYGADAPGERLAGDVVVEAGRGRSAWEFREALRRRVGEPGPQPAFRLEVDLALEEEGLAISERDDITRIDIRGVARFVLTDRASGTELERGVARSSSGYNTLGSPFATRAARLDAERRVIEDLASRVWIDLAARLGSEAA